MLFDLRHPIRQQPRSKHRITYLTLWMPPICCEPAQVKRSVVRQPGSGQDLEEEINFSEAIFVRVE